MIINVGLNFFLTRLFFLINSMCQIKLQVNPTAGEKLSKFFFFLLFL